jgi:hypothetical protein
MVCCVQDQAMRVEVWRALLRERGIVTDEDKKEQRERFEAARKAEAEEKQRLLKEKREQVSFLYFALKYVT